MRGNFQKVPGKYDLLHLDYKASDAVSPWEPEGMGRRGGGLWFPSSSWLRPTSCQGDEEIAPQKTTSGPKPASRLDLRVQALVEMICSIRTMEEMVMEMKYDSKKAPLGTGSPIVAFVTLLQDS